MNATLSIGASTAVGAAVGLGLFSTVRAVVRRARRIDLKGRVAIVTGGSRGLGLLLAEELGRHGAIVAICGRDEDALDAARERLAGQGIRGLARACDVGDRAMAEAFVDEVAETFGRIDVVVNNAGIIRVGALDDQTVDDIEAVMRSNFLGAVHVTFRARAHLRVHGRDARIVNIGSIGGRVGLPHMAGYCASKFALTGLSETMRGELDGVRGGARVVTVIPGLMRTGSFENAEFLGKTGYEFDWFATSSSLPLLTIDPHTAARRIVRAVRDGRPFLHLGLTSHLGEAMHRLSPSLTARALAIGTKIMPNAGRLEGEKPVRGRDIYAALRSSRFLSFGVRGAAANNENPPA